jgi:hypothetical protein
MNYIIIFATFFSSFFGLFKNKESLHVQLSHKISRPFAKRIAKKYGMNGSGGGGAFINTINEVCFFFDTKRSISINECRREYVEMLTEILCLYNHNEEVRPHLRNYPFTAKNINIFIIYNDDPNICIKDRVYTANATGGTIYYRIRNTNTTNDEDYYEETFEEAYFKVYGKAWEP